MSSDLNIDQEVIALRTFARSPILLILGFILYIFSCSWALWSLCRAAPWLLPLSASLVCFALHFGVIDALPNLRSCLERTPYQLFCELVAIGSLYGCNLARLFLLAAIDLNEAQHRQILTEFSPDFRRKAFREPALMLLPSWLRKVCCLPGKDPLRSPMSSQTEIGFEDLPSVAGLLGAATPIMPKVDDILEMIKTVESSQFVREQGRSKLRKVINEKVADVAVLYVKHASRYELMETLRSICHIILAVLAGILFCLTLPFRLVWAFLLLIYQLFGSKQPKALPSPHGLSFVTSALDRLLRSLRLLLRAANAAVEAAQETIFEGVIEDVRADSKIDTNQFSRGQLRQRRTIISQPVEAFVGASE